MHPLTFITEELWLTGDAQTHLHTLEYIHLYKMKGYNTASPSHL